MIFWIYIVSKPDTVDGQTTIHHGTAVDGRNPAPPGMYKIL